MIQLDTLLSFCKDSYNQRSCNSDTSKCICGNKCKVKGCYNCEGCLEDIHNRNNENSDYNCEFQTYYYVMKFFYRYASEIAIVLQENLQSLLNNTEINIVSIGCGPSSELYGIRAFLLIFNSVSRVNYFGFDLNPIWHTIQQKNIDILPEINVNYSTNNGFDFIRNSNGVNLLILNYVLSDLARRNDSSDIDRFISSLEEIIETKKVDYILINDIYLTYETRTAYAIVKQFVRFCINNGIRKEDIIRYQFKEPNQFQDRIGWPPKTNRVVFQQNIDLDSIGPWTELRSMGIIIKVK